MSKQMTFTDFEISLYSFSKPISLEYSYIADIAWLSEGIFASSRAAIGFNPPTTIIPTLSSPTGIPKSD